MNRAIAGRKDVSKVVELTPAPTQLELVMTAPQGPNLSDGDRAEAERRFGVIEPLLDREKYHLLWVQHPRKLAMIAYLCAAHKVTQRTLYRWLAAYQKDGLPGLVSKDRSDKGVARKMSTPARDLLVAMAMPRRGAYGVLSVAEMWRAFEEERAWRELHLGKKLGDFDRSKYERYADEDGRLKPESLLPAVSYNCFNQWFAKIPEIARVMARDGEECYRNSQEIISWRNITEIQPMDYVVMDHRVLDLFCLFPTRGGWKLARPWLTAAIDMRTRKWLAWSIVETPSSDSIATVIKRVFIDFGLPWSVYWDNGKDFRCEWLEGHHERRQQSARVGELDATWRGVMGTLGVRVHHAIVHNARAKIIEPNFNRISNFDRQQPEWCGHRPTERPERFGALVKQHEQWEKGERQATPFRTVHEIAALYKKAIEDLNEREMDGAEGMCKATPRGRGWWSPNEAWEVLIGQVQRRSAPAEVLHMCFAKRRRITVKHGEIRATHAGRDYHYRMQNPAALMAVNGEQVEIAYDPHDLGEVAVYLQDRFLGLACCVELRRMGEASFVDDERLRRAARREVKRFIESVTAVPVAGPETRLDRRREVLPVRVEVPRVEVPIELPAPVVAAEAAVRADRAEAADHATVEMQVAERPSLDGEDDEFQFFK